MTGAMAFGRLVNTTDSVNTVLSDNNRLLEGASGATTATWTIDPGVTVSGGRCFIGPIADPDAGPAIFIVDGGGTQEITRNGIFNLRVGRNGADGKSKPSFSGIVETFSFGENAFHAASLTFLDLSGFSGLEMLDGIRHASAGQLGLAGLGAQTGDLTAPMVGDDKGRHYLVTDTMGKKSLNPVDLGSRPCILFEQAAKDLGLATRDLEGTINTLGTLGIPRKGATLTSLKPGDHLLPSSLDMVVLPGTDTEEVDGVPVIGIMGSMFFEHFRSTIDFHTHKITFPAEVITGNP